MKNAKGYQKGSRVQIITGVNEAKEGVVLSTKIDARRGSMRLCVGFVWSSGITEEGWYYAQDVKKVELKKDAAKAIAVLRNAEIMTTAQAAKEIGKAINLLKNVSNIMVKIDKVFSGDEAYAGYDADSVFIDISNLAIQLVEQKRSFELTAEGEKQ